MRTLLAGCAFALAGALAVPGAAGAQVEGGAQRCRLRLEHADSSSTSGKDNYFAAGDVRLSCVGTTIRMRSDSLASYGGQITEFIGHVRYEDSSMVMTADFGTYYRAGERWEARGNVVTTSAGGSSLRGPSLDYYRVVPGQRDTVEVFATGRPTIDYVPRDSAGKTQEPYVIVGDRVRMKGEDRLWAGGRVTIDRSDLAASADSMRLDTGPGQDGSLVGGAQIRGLGKDPFTLSGARINLTLEHNDLSYVQSNGNGRATSADWTLVADTIGLDVNDRVLEQTVAWGATMRPHATSSTYEILADSLALDTPKQVLTEARGFGKAWVASGGDSVAADRDWLRGDTVTARFAQVDSAGKTKTAVRQIEAWRDASAYYQVKSPDHPGVPSLNYARGSRIVVTMRDDAAGGVDRVEIEGKVDGVQLEPKTVAARDSTAGKPGAASGPPATPPPVTQP